MVVNVPTGSQTDHHAATLVVIEQSAQARSAANRTHASGLGAIDERVPEPLMIPFKMVEVHKSTHIILSGGRSVIRGIRGSAVLWPCTKHSSNVGSPCVGAAAEKNGKIDA